MRILTPEAAKKGSSVAEDELRARVRDLSAEEERLVKSVNSLRAEEESEKERIGRDTEAFRADARAERDRLSAEISAKESEVGKIEERRAETMKPIEDVRAEADARNEKSKECEAALSKATDELNILSADLAERANDRRQELDEREEDIRRREKGIEAEETALKESEKRLVGKWAEIHATIESLNERTSDLEQRENRAATAEKANEDRAVFLDGQDRALADRERLLRSNYQALEAAKKHLGIQ